MPSISELKSIYSKLPNSRLASLLGEKGSLSPEARQVLDDEVQKRNSENGIVIVPAVSAISLKENPKEAANQIYEYAANLLVNENKAPHEVKNELMNQGLDEEDASAIVENLENQLKQAKKENANKDMLWGALWCFGGIVATVADFGYVFWGAIIFGGIQFFKGLANSQ